jgi:hypothetical protein
VFDLDREFRGLLRKEQPDIIRSVVTTQMIHGQPGPDFRIALVVVPTTVRQGLFQCVFLIEGAFFTFAT